MQTDRLLHISTGGSRKATKWQQVEIYWSEFCERLTSPVRSTETLEEYLAFPKPKQDELKDVGGFVGGTLEGGRRKAVCVTGRDLVTLDLDNIPSGGTDDILQCVSGLGCSAAVYSTRKHASYAPRLRIIIPLDRTAAPDEYEPIARKIAQLIGLKYCDPTTFEAVRLMYWPSVSSDSEYICQVYDKAFCSASGILGMYGDWTDISQWPQVPGQEAIEKKRAAKQEDPLAKSGIVGAFCRSYSVPEAMDRFIPGIYEETETPGRYTYTGGSTVGGAVLYDDGRFLFSHHATDPCSGQLVNAFDLVRLHKYDDRDTEAPPGTPNNRLPSYEAMTALALEDPSVSALMAKEKAENASAAFANGPAPEELDLAWTSQLQLDSAGNYRKTINNLILILEHDPQVRGKIVTDEFAGCGLVMGEVPWNRSPERRRWTDTDDAGALWFMETFYGIPSRDKLLAALSIVGGQHTINEVRDYLQGLTWDGRPRVDQLLTDYLGAEDNAYTQAVIRKSLCAAVGRAIEGGIKYDFMPILTGPQGIGKSTFLANLGMGWFSDSLTTFEGKEAAELIQGTWINEVGELTALTKQETNNVKQFLSKRSDIYRAAYGKRTEEHPRRCVFFGTSNDAEFLKDTTGNRRFWPVNVGVQAATKSVWNDMPKEIDQIWAEAYARWKAGEPLYLTGDLEAMARAAQEEHSEVSGWEGLIEEYLQKEVPANWDRLDLQQKRMFLRGQMTSSEPLRPLFKVCAVEVWCEALGGEMRLMRPQDRSRINAILGHMPGWRKNKSSLRYGVYGTQRGYERVSTLPVNMA